MTAHLSLKPESPGRPGALCFVTSTEELWHEASPKEATSARGPSLWGSWCQLLRVGVHGVLCHCVEASVWALLGSWDLLFPPFPRAPSLETQPRCLSVFRIQGWLLCEHFGVRGLDPVGTSEDACPGERRVGGVGAVGSPHPPPGLAISGGTPCCPPHLELLACVGSGLGRGCVCARALVLLVTCRKLS